MVRNGNCKVCGVDVEVDYNEPELCPAHRGNEENDFFGREYEEEI